jgi:hypothetical protein
MDCSPDAVREFTQRCTDVLEMYVRRSGERDMDVDAGADA